MNRKNVDKVAPEIRSSLRHSIVETPDIIRRASGIIINGRRYKSFLFSTDVATIAFSDADAVLAVYPFTPSPNIIQGIRQAAPIPVVAGVGGGITSGKRSADMALFAESMGAFGVVMNAQASIETIQEVRKSIDVPIIYTVISKHLLIQERLDAGVQILNVSGGKHTARLVRRIREEYPDVPIIATGGGKDEHILETIQAGANAISYTPPSSRDLFQANMEGYREDMIDRHGSLTD